ncbi:MAG: SsrA-binding protein SmpB [Minisyncoccia bacterium]
MSKALIQNRKATFNYEILEKFMTGIVLSGQEVRSLREGHGNLEGTYVVIRGGEAFLINAEIPAYQPKNASEDYEPRQNRKLLLLKKEIAYLLGQEKAGLTIVPLAMYNMGKKIKVEIALAKGKKKHDKRETIKKRESDRDVQRTLKGE